MELTSALEEYCEAMAATQTSILEAFVEKLLTLPRRCVRRVKKGKIAQDDIDDRLEILAMFYSWRDPEEDLPDGSEPATSLEGVASMLSASSRTLLPTLVARRHQGPMKRGKNIFGPCTT